MIRAMNMMEAVRTSETSVNLSLTIWRYIPEDSKLHIRSRETLKSYLKCVQTKQAQKAKHSFIAFSVQNCFNQGYALSPLLYNFVVGYAVLKVQQNKQLL
jgi:hypothetical protein